MEELPRALRESHEKIRLLGMGASGMVYLARNKASGDEVAVKVMRIEDRVPPKRRFARECEALTRLNHPSILKLYDHGIEGTEAYLVTEFLEGNSLKESRAGVDVVDAALQLAGALDAVHTAGLIHRDVKPANVVVTPQGRAVLLDFGLAYDPSQTKVTRTGTVPGTVAYQAPEVLLRGEATPAADWYAWAGCLYFCLEGSSPFPALAVYSMAEGKAPPALKFEKLESEDPRRWLIEAGLHPDPQVRLTGEAAARAVLAGQRPSLPPPTPKPMSVSANAVKGRSAAATVKVGAHSSSRPFVIGGIGLAGCLGLLAWVLQTPRAPSPPTIPVVPTVSPSVTVASAPLPSLLPVVPQLPDAEPQIPGLGGKGPGALADQLQNMLVNRGLGIRLSPLFYLDPRRVLFTGADGSVGVFDLETSGVVARFKGHTQEVQHLALSPARDLAASCGWDGRLRLFDPQTMEVVHDIEAGGRSLNAVDFSPNGELVAVSGDIGEVRIFNVSTGALVRRLKGYASRVIEIRFSRDKGELITGDIEGVLRRWNPRTGEKLGAIQSEGGSVSAIIEQDGGALLFTGHMDGKVRVWDRATLGLKRTLDAHSAHVAALDFSPYASHLISAGFDGRVKVWNLDDWSVVKTMTGSDERLFGIALSPNSSQLTTLDQQNIVRTWSYVRGEQLSQFAIRTGETEQSRPVAALAGDAGRILSVADLGEDRLLVLHDAGRVVTRRREAGTIVVEAEELYKSVRVVVGAAAGDLALAGTGEEVVLLDRATLARKRVLRDHGGGVSALAISADGAQLVSSSWDGVIRLWPAAGGEPQVLQSRGEPATSLRFTERSGGLMVGDKGGAVRWWRRFSSPPVDLGAHPTAVTAFVVDQEEGMMVSGSEDGKLFFWDLTQGILQDTVEGHEKRVTSLAFLADGSTLASAGWDGLVRIWALEGDEDLKTLRGHEGPVEAVMPLPSGRVLTAGWDGKLLVWEP